MLIITRKPNQGFYITDDIYVCIIDAKGAQVRIGIDAPETMPIAREELMGKFRGFSSNADDEDIKNQSKEYRRLKQLERMRVCCSSA